MKKIKIMIVLVLTSTQIPSHTLNWTGLPNGRDKPKLVERTIELKPFQSFLHDIGFTESGNVYTKVNTLGYLGKYQFGKSTLKTLKYKGSYDTFLKSAKLQERYMKKNLKFNKRRLNKIIEQNVGKFVDGVMITESGILAAAHLAGAGNVIKYFKHKSNPKDDYGTSLETYLKTFSGYQINI